jgi:hypothetical protein
MALTTHGFSTTGWAQAPTVIDRINEVRREKDKRETVAAMKQGVSTRSALLRGLEGSGLQDVSARNAVTWLSTVSGLSIILNWQQLQEAGINPDQLVSVGGAGLTTERALRLIMDQMGDNVPLVYDITPWYVEVLTKEHANRRSIVQVYLIGDLLHAVPNFTDAPVFDLSVVGQSGKAGGGGGNIFQQPPDAGQQPSRQEQIEAIVKLITDTIEPEIWTTNGGQHGSISVYRDSLIIRAPRYVHQQIGTPSAGGEPLGAAGFSAVPVTPAAPIRNAIAPIIAGPSAAPAPRNEPAQSKSAGVIKSRP